MKFTLLNKFKQRIKDTLSVVSPVEQERWLQQRQEDQLAGAKSLVDICGQIANDQNYPNELLAFNAALKAYCEKIIAGNASPADDEEFSGQLSKFKQYVDDFNYNYQIDSDEGKNPDDKKTIASLRNFANCVSNFAKSIKPAHVADSKYNVRVNDAIHGMQRMGNLLAGAAYLALGAGLVYLELAATIPSCFASWYLLHPTIKASYNCAEPLLKSAASPIVSTPKQATKALESALVKLEEVLSTDKPQVKRL